jgi:hypothetical protein
MDLSWHHRCSCQQVQLCMSFWRTTGSGMGSASCTSTQTAHRLSMHDHTVRWCFKTWQANPCLTQCQHTLFGSCLGCVWSLSFGTLQQRVHLSSRARHSGCCAEISLPSARCTTSHGAATRHSTQCTPMLTMASSLLGQRQSAGASALLPCTLHCLILNHPPFFVAAMVGHFTRGPVVTLAAVCAPEQHCPERCTG